MLKEVKDRGYVDVVHLGLYLGFFIKAVHKPGIANQIGIYDFNRNVSVELLVYGFVDRTHAAESNLFRYPVMLNDLIK